MAKKTGNCPEFIKTMGWSEIIFLLFLVIFLAGLTYKHYFTQQQQIRWQKLQELKTTAANNIIKLDITDELLKKADLDNNQKIDQADIKIMEEAFLAIDSNSLEADLNQDGRVDTQDYAILAHIISSQKLN